MGYRVGSDGDGSESSGYDEGRRRSRSHRAFLSVSDSQVSSRLVDAINHPQTVQNRHNLASENGIPTKK